MITGSCTLNLRYDHHEGREGDERRVGGLGVENDGAVDGSVGRCVVVGGDGLSLG